MPVLAVSFQGRKEIARGRNGGTTRGPGPRSIGGRWERLDPLGAAGRRGRAGRHHVHRERAVRQAAPDARPPRPRSSGRTSPSGTRRPATSLAVIEVDDPMAAFLAVRSHLNGGQRPRWTGIHPQACVAPTGPDRAGRGDLSVRVRRRGRRDRRRLDPPSRRRHRRRLHAGPGVHHPSQRRALSRRRPGRPGRGPRRDRARRRRLRLPARSTAGTSRSRIPAGSRSATTSRSARTARSTARRSRPPGSARGPRSTTWS